MRHRISPATLIASVALFVSLGGTGWAASRYLITSTSQIKPTVLHKLKGRRGPLGHTGQRGPQGVPGVGPQGVQGPPGPQGNPVVWDQASFQSSLTANLTAADPSTALTARCSSDDWQVITGGYEGSNEIVTTDEPFRSRLPLGQGHGANAWIVEATLIPGQMTGAVTAWVLCAPQS